MIPAKVCYYCFYMGCWIIKGKPFDFCSRDNTPLKQPQQTTCERYEKSYPAIQLERWHKEDELKREKQTTQLSLFEVE